MYVQLQLRMVYDDGLDRLCVTDVSATQLVYNRPAAGATDVL